MNLTLVPFGEPALQHFMFLERPEGMALEGGKGIDAPVHEAVPPMAEGDIVPRLQDFATVGHLYRSIEQGLAHLAEKFGERNLFVGPPRAQATSTDFRWPELVAVTDLASAQRALDTILERIQHRAAQLVQRRERQLPLGLHRQPERRGDQTPSDHRRWGIYRQAKRRSDDSARRSRCARSGRAPPPDVERAQPVQRLALELAVALRTDPQRRRDLGVRLPLVAVDAVSFEIKRLPDEVDKAWHAPNGDGMTRSGTPDPTRLAGASSDR